MPDQSGTHGIVNYVQPLRIIGLARTQSRIPMIRLPFLRGDAARPCKTGFPKADPIIQRDLLSARGREEVQVIRHQDVAFDEPGAGVLPGLAQSGVVFRRCQPGATASRANRHENNDGVRLIDPDTMSRLFSWIHRSSPIKLDRFRNGSDGASPSQENTICADRFPGGRGSVRAAPSRSDQSPEQVRSVTRKGEAPRHPGITRGHLEGRCYLERPKTDFVTFARSLEPIDAWLSTYYFRLSHFT
jgi:hypothetical protein